MHNLTKVNKVQAAKALKTGLSVAAIASLMNPSYGDGMFLCQLDKNTVLDNNWVNRFKYYNCNKEQGTGIHFYIIEQIK